MIEQSIAKQYGVLPSGQDNLKYSDWSKMVSGLMDDTPLGRVIALRGEKDSEVLKNFTEGQKKARSDWFSFINSKQKQVEKSDDTVAQINELEKMLAGLFGGR